MLQLHSSEFVLPKAADITGDDACGFELLDNEVLIAVLCDGVGSAKKGGVAARETVNFFLRQFKTRPKAWDIPKTITTFTQHINRQLFKESMTQYERVEYLTTLNVAVIEGDMLYTMNLGDSKIYLQDKSFGVRQLSVDHVMDDEHMSHVLTQACGLSEHIDPIITKTPLEKGNSVILCSDGVSNLIDEDTLNEEVERGLSAKLIVQKITRDHEDHQRDDASLQIFKIEALDELYAIRNKPLPIPETLKKGDNFDGYVLQEPMMSHKRIWKADKEGSTFVIKFPMSHDDEQALDEFVREAWYAKQIHHRSFGQAWVPEDRTARYYVMELIEGTNLLDYLKNNTLSIDNTIALAKFLHKAEAHLLNLGLVHGDIKPENIIVYKNENEAGVQFKMVDFGSIVEIFATNSRAGTPTYLAPERFKGASINESTEIFSIGVTLYWALTGKFPYGEIEPFQSPTFKTAKAPSKFNKNIPEWLDAIIMRAVAADASMRYSHYSEFFYELKAPEKVKPYFDKEAPLIEREPLKFYKYGFFGLLLLNIFGLIFVTFK
jgi:serine/threonine protein kinase